jgi:hypothetical protein
MNLIKAAELLKGAPDTELDKYLQQPTGEFPEYLVASEKMRRDDMRKKYAAANQGQPTKTSIIEELLQKDNQQMRQQQPQMPQQMPPEAMGLGAVPPPQGMQLTPSPIMEAAQQQPQQFYHGGAVSFAHGGLAGLSGEIHDYLQGYAQGGLAGEINDYLHGYAIGGAVDRFALPDWAIQQQQLPEAMTREQAFNLAQQQMGPSAVEGSDTMLNERQKRLEENKKNYLPNFLINAGLNMAASKGNFLTAAATGALQGFESHQKAKAADEEAQRQLEDSKFKFQAAQRAEKAGLIGLSNQLYSSYENSRNMAIDNNRQAGALQLNAEQARTVADHYREMAGISRKQLANQTAEIGLRHQERADALAQAADLRTQGLYEKAWEKMQDARKAIQTNIAKGEVPDYYHEEVSKMTGMSPLQKQVALQRLNQRMEADYGITPEVRTYANRLFPTKQG